MLGQDITALGVIRALHRSGIRCLSVAGRDDIAGWSRCAESGPLTDVERCRPECFETWVSTQQPDPLVLMPCSDVWAEVLAGVDSQKIPNVRTWSASPEAVQALVDKSIFRQWLADLELPHPLTVPVTGQSDLGGALDSAFERAFLKPHQSSAFLAEFGVKGCFVSNRDEAKRKLIDIQERGLSVVLQEYVPGAATNHFFIDGYRSSASGETRLLARKRLRMFPLELGNSTDMVTVPIDDVAPAVRSLETLFDALGYHGIFSAEFKFDDRDKLFKLLEVNCRPWWYIQFADECGLEVCKWAYQESLGEPMDSFAGYPAGRRAVYPIRDWAARRAGSEAKSTGLLSAVRSWLGAHQPIMSWRDPLPAMFNFWQHLERALRKRLPFRAATAPE